MDSRRKVEEAIMALKLFQLHVMDSIPLYDDPARIKILLSTPCNGFGVVQTCCGQVQHSYPFNSM
jgi:hypothetical protein